RGAESDRLALAFGEFDDDVTRHRSIRLWLALGSETRRGGVEQAGLRESGAVLVELVRRVALIRLPGRQLLEEVLARAGKAVDLHIAEGGPATGLQLEGDLDRIVLRIGKCIDRLTDGVRIAGGAKPGDKCIACLDHWRGAGGDAGVERVYQTFELALC